MKTILFISHDASRTGAPILLLNFLKWFKQNSQIPFKILLGRGGPLESEFADLAPTLRLDQPPRRNLSQKVLSRLGFQEPASLLGQWLAQDEVGLIYSNTITNHQALRALSFLQCPVISHIHELESWIYRSGKQNFDITKDKTTRFIAVSDAVRDNLVRNHQVRADQIDKVYEFVQTTIISPEKAKNYNFHTRQQLGIPQEAFVVGSCGTLDWRKGSDLFIQTARLVRHKFPDAPIHFLWLGGGNPNENLRFFELQYDIQKLKLDSYIHFPGSKSNPQEYFSAFDVFALFSREDPYPLVCLEAASLGKPILCFDESGGEPEFVEEDCGFVIPYLDLETFAEKIHLLSESPALKQQLGETAKQKVQARHDVQLAGSQILNIVEHVLSSTY
jgi:glycosyltransferase involved in cell wall biosynthesis